MRKFGIVRVGLAGLLVGVSAMSGCSTGEGIAVGAALGALTGLAVSSLDDGDVHVHSYSYRTYEYGPRWHGYSRWDGWGGHSPYGRSYRHYGYRDRGWGWHGPRSPYQCDY